MKGTKFLILFLFYISVLLIKGKLHEPDKFIIYDQRIEMSIRFSIWNTGVSAKMYAFII